MTRRNVVLSAAVLLLVAASGIVGYLLAKSGDGGASPAAANGRAILYWYDPMVPAEHYPGPGKSSMNMDLIPKYADEGGAGGITVSPAMTQNLGIRLARVEVRDFSPTIQAVGRIEADERGIVEVQTLTPGYVEQLAVRAVGESVGSGSRVASVYSPELLTAQAEYVALLKSRATVSGSLRQAARSRLSLLGLPSAALRRLERGGAPQRTYAVFARAGGIVTAIGARPGARVEAGQSIVTLASFSRVLAVAEVPETALGQIKVGQPVRITFPAYPGEQREAQVDYIYPTLDSGARTARVRATLSNPGLRLKAGMFANMVIEGAGGMALVVPSEAVIDTGRRRIVIVSRNGAFVPVEVATGRDVGEETQILSGLQRGEEVVASGQFLIDSEASLTGVVARLQSGQSTQQRMAPRLASGTGVIRVLDPAGGRLTIAHGPIPALDWPARTTTFAVADPTRMRGLKRGDRVAFTVGMAPQGNYFVIDRIGRDPTG